MQKNLCIGFSMKFQQFRSYTCFNFSNLMMNESDIKEFIEEKFRRIIILQYTTDTPLKQLEEEVEPYLGRDITFKDPWQEGSGRELYKLGLKGFHCMFNFDFELLQITVDYNEKKKEGRVLADGIMHLKQFKRIISYSYPLRTFLVYNFVVSKIDSEKKIVSFEIKMHDEMWSLGDMIENAPLIGGIYRWGFRRLFAAGFLTASAISYLIQRALKAPVVTKDKLEGVKISC